MICYCYRSCSTNLESLFGNSLVSPFDCVLCLFWVLSLSSRSSVYSPGSPLTSLLFPFLSYLLCLVSALRVGIVRRACVLFVQDTNAQITNSTTVNISTLNLARDRGAEFPAIFMIILFLVVVITLSLLAVSVVMWGMDPGRDSIVYRMTEQPRVKLE